jgi:hypothetical protein
MDALPACTPMPKPSEKKRKVTIESPQWPSGASRRADSRGHAVPDPVWDEAADNFDEKELSAIILLIATTNFFNRINVTIQEPAGTSW